MALRGTSPTINTMKARTKLGIVAVSGVVLGATACRILQLVFADKIVDWPTTLGAVSDIAQTIALVVAGVWTYHLFVRQRISRHRAEVGLSAQVIARDQESALLRVTLTISNVGQVELCPYKATIRIQEVQRVGSKLSIPASKDGGALPEHERIPAYRELVKCRIDLKEDALTLEPDESERYYADFLLAQGSGLIQVYAIVDTDDSDESDYWDDAVLCDMDTNHHALATTVTSDESAI